MNKIGSDRVASVREDLLNKTRLAKAEIVSHLQHGDRDWPKLYEICARYAQLQDAADVLGGMTAIELAPPTLQGGIAL